MASVASQENKLAVNNGRRTPLQGFDVNIYVQDQGSGNLIPLGEFTGFQHVIRNATEPYLPLGNRTMNLLDGEFQIGWVAEQGKINLDAVRQVFGFSTIGPVVRLGRSPRFQIVVEYDAPELHESSDDDIRQQYLYNDIYAKAVTSSSTANKITTESRTRSAKGRYVFGFCKVDAYTTGIMAGRTAVADRIEGLAETWYWMPIVGNGASSIITRQTLSDGTASSENYYRGVDFGNNESNKIPSWADTNT